MENGDKKWKKMNVNKLDSTTCIHNVNTKTQQYEQRDCRLQIFLEFAVIISVV
jgi:hypothetical protein